MSRVVGQFETRLLGKEVCEGCGEAVQVVQVISRGSLPGGTFKFGCRCKEIQIVREIMAENERRKFERIVRVFDNESLMPKSLRNATFDTFQASTLEQRAVLQVAREYAGRFNRDEPENLLFTGPYGTGKSHLAVSIVRVLMERGFTGIFITVPEMLTKLKSTYDKKSEFSEGDMLQALKSVDVLVLDDIGAEYSGQSAESWAVSKIFEVMNARQGMHTIYTTNLHSEQLQEKLGARNFSRMCENTRIVRFEGADYRLRKMKK